MWVNCWSYAIKDWYPHGGRRECHVVHAFHSRDGRFPWRSKRNWPFHLVLWKLYWSGPAFYSRLNQLTCIVTWIRVSYRAPNRTLCENEAPQVTAWPSWKVVPNVVKTLHSVLKIRLQGGCASLPSVNNVIKPTPCQLLSVLSSPAVFHKLCIVQYMCKK